MKRIKELIVVEGKHDKARLDKLFDCDVLITGGLSLQKQQIEIIKQAANRQGVIIMTDPDFPGKKIRDMIVAEVPNAKHVFIDKKDAIGKRNVGIEYVADELIVSAIENAVTFEENQDSISWAEYLNLQLINDKKKRDQLTSALKLGQCNNKKLFHYLNMLGYSYKDVTKVLEGLE